jgi:hypothetical protein
MADSKTELHALGLLCETYQKSRYWYLQLTDAYPYNYESKKTVYFNFQVILYSESRFTCI